MTNRTLTILLAATAAAVLWQSAAAGGRLACRRVSAADGLPSNNINCIAQDADGYIWFGTTNGLSRFDGYSAVNFTSLSPDGGGPTDRRIGSISIEGQTMTVTTSNSARATYDLGRARFTAYTPAPAAPRQAVALAARGTQRLTRLVDRLMEFRKVSAGSMRLSVERGDIVQTVRRAADDL